MNTEINIPQEAVKRSIRNLLFIIAILTCSLIWIFFQVHQLLQEVSAQYITKNDARIEAIQNKQSLTIYAGGIVAVILAALLIILLFYLNKCRYYTRKAQSLSSLPDASYLTMVENMPMLVFTTDINGNITYVNSLVYSITEYTPEELIGKDFSFLLHPSWMQQVFNHYTEQFIARTPTTTIEFIIRTKSGQQKWVRQTGCLIMQGSIVTGFQCTAEDITNTKQIEFKNAESLNKQKAYKELLETTIENATCAIFIKDITGKYLYINRRYKEIFGVTDEKMLNKTAYDIHPPDKAAYYTMMDEELINTRKPVEKEEWIEGPFGNKNLILLKFPLTDTKKKVFAIGGIGVDITDRVIYQQKLIQARKISDQQRQSQEDFFAKVGQEVRTSMHGILEICNMLFQADLVDTQKKYTNQIKGSVGNIQSLLDDALLFSAIKSGHKQLEQTSFKIQNIITDLRLHHEPDILRKGLQLYISVDEKIPAILTGDSYHLTKVLLYILSNAVKFTVNGSIQIKVMLKNKTSNNITIEIQIADTGIGISDNMIDSIFDPFAQAGSNISRNYDGAGLGLAITKELVKMMKGTIEVKSKLNEGSVFTLNFPFTSTTENTIKESGDALLKGKHFLIVEDNEVNQKLIGYVLKKVGGVVDIASDGRIAIDYLEDKQYDLIIMDLQMPVMDGFEASAHIREVLHLKIPIIAITATALADDIERINRIGINDFMLKPFDFDDLYNRILMLLYPNKVLPKLNETDSAPRLYDLSLLEGLDDPESLLDVLNLFLDNTPAQFTELLAAGKQQDWPTVFQIAHKLKGALGMLQAKEITDLLSTIESDAKSRNNTHQILPIIIEVHSLFEQLEVQLINERNRLTKEL